jgi:hypothetical protein
MSTIQYNIENNVILMVFNRDGKHFNIKKSADFDCAKFGGNSEVRRN